MGISKAALSPLPNKNKLLNIIKIKNTIRGSSYSPLAFLEPAFFTAFFPSAVLIISAQFYSNAIQARMPVIQVRQLAAIQLFSPIQPTLSCSVVIGQKRLFSDFSLTYMLLSAPP